MTRKHRDYSARLGDYLFSCAICKCPTWASERVVLDKYTGRGGLWVCPDDADVIDYGLVPYKIPAERPVYRSQDLINSNNPEVIPETYPPFDYVDFNPLSTTPQQNAMSATSWDKQNLFTWDTWSYVWNLN